MPPEAVPSNASVASTGLGLRYIGQHCYAYSGIILSADGSKTCLGPFTSGSGYITGKYLLSGGLFISDVGEGANIIYTLKLNDQIIWEIKITTNPEGSPTAYTPPLLIPPITKVEILVQASQANLECSASLTGRVYGAD